MLTKPKNEMGYTKEELKKICQDRKISFKKFNTTFGVNTVAVGKNGELYFYECDVRKTLYELGDKDGVWSDWD
jgi:hypothetical protein